MITVHVEYLLKLPGTKHIITAAVNITSLIMFPSIHRRLLLLLWGWGDLVWNRLREWTPRYWGDEIWKGLFLSSL